LLDITKRPPGRGADTGGSGHCRCRLSVLIRIISPRQDASGHCRQGINVNW
jgi:hypothetical protein